MTIVMGDDSRPGRGGWDDMDWGRMHDGIGWGGWLLMALLGLLLVALVVGLVVLLLVRPPGGGRASGAGAAGGAPPAGSSTAEQVLGERYARGEIDEEEYLRRRSVLRGG